MTPSQKIDRQIDELDGWRGGLVKHIRELILAADQGISEDWKWNTGVWMKAKPICAVAAFKDHVKVNFFKGAELNDPNGLFNGGLDAKLSRSIDLREGDQLDAAHFQALVRRASE